MGMFIWHRRVAAKSNSPMMTALLQARPYDRFIEINSNLKRKKSKIVPVFYKMTISSSSLHCLVGQTQVQKAT